jgi:hypothetical protein
MTGESLVETFACERSWQLRERAMSDETISDCFLCRGLDVGQRAAMRAGLIEIPRREALCDRCMVAFSVNLLGDSRKGRRSGYGRTESRE